MNEVQRHVHSNACKKKGKMCRFSFPRPPSCRTIICRGLPEDMSSEKASADQTRNDPSHKQDRQESPGQNMTLNHQQQQSQKQGETNSHPYRKD